MDSELQFFHRRSLEHAVYDVVTQQPGTEHEEDEHFEAAYRWLEKEIGFYGIFLAAGEKSLPITGYDYQFKRPRDPVEKVNSVLFGYRELPEVRFTDYDTWHIVLNSVVGYNEQPPNLRVEHVSEYHRRLVFKPSWRQSDWFRAARNNRVYAQAHAPELDLRQADEIWCRNIPTKKELVSRGFEEEKIVVKRVKPLT